MAVYKCRPLTFFDITVHTTFNVTFSSNQVFPPNFSTKLCIRRNYLYMCRMQPNEESSNTGSGSRTQPTKEQEEYAQGFSAALHRLYAQRGTPAAVRVRKQSTPSDLDPTVPSKSSAAMSAACSAGQSSSSGVVLSVAGISIRSQSLPAVVRNMMTSADSQSASTKIPLCVTNLESNVSDDRLDDQPQNQQPTCDRNSSGMNQMSVDQ